MLLQLPRLPMLTAVTLRSHSMGAERVAASVGVLAGCTKLSLLDLSGNQAYEAGLDAVGMQLHSWPELHVLRLQNNASSTYEQLPCADELASGLAHVMQLSELNLCGSMGMCAHMQRAIAALPALRSLHIEWPLVQSPQPGLRLQLTCVDFGVGDKVITESALEARRLLPRLSQCSALRAMKLPLATDAVDIKAVEWSAWPQLEHLRLGAFWSDYEEDLLDDIIGEAAIVPDSLPAALAAAAGRKHGVLGLSTLTRLTCLELGGKVSDPDIEWVLREEGIALACVLATLPQLQQLNVSNEFSSYHERFFAHGAARAPKLLALELLLGDVGGLCAVPSDNAEGQLCNLQQLNSLTLSLVHEGMEFHAPADNILRLQQLTALSVSGGEGRGKNIADHLVRGVSQLRHLHSLELQSLDVPSVHDLLHLAGVLSQLTSLRVFSCDVGFNQAAHVPPVTVHMGGLLRFAFVNCTGCKALLVSVAEHVRFSSAACVLKELELCFDFLKQDIVDECLEAQLCRKFRLVLWYEDRVDVAAEELIDAHNASHAGDWQLLSVLVKRVVR